MQAVKPMQIGVMFWAGKDPAETLATLTAIGVHCGQIGIPGELPLAGEAEKWKQALDAAGFSLVTVFASYIGESYADIPTVQQTVGFIPRATRQEREARTLEMSDFAAVVGAPYIACHIGFVPEDHSDPDFIAVRDMVRRICDYAAQKGQSFALETGQEPAATLLEFFRAVDRPNLRINFDPANLILYGTGDPIEALDVLGAHVVTVHCKDGDWPPKDQPGALGTEQPLGQGAVGIPRFIDKLRQIGYTGPLCIEREVPDQAQRLADVKMAVGLLRKLTA
jgi:sugar phosphate isomerase/epimerase